LERKSLPVVSVFIAYTLGFYVYSIGVFFGMPAFLDGYLVTAAAAGIPLLMWSYWRVFAQYVADREIDIIVWTMLGYWLLWMVIVGAKDNNPIEFISYAGTVISWVMLFMLGRVIPFYARHLAPIAAVIFITLFVLTLSNTESGSFTPAQSAEYFATYQAYAVVLCIVTFTLFYLVERIEVFWAIGLISIISLAILGSRSELIGMLFATFLIGNHRKFNLWALTLQITVLSGLYVAYMWITDAEWNRFINLVDEHAESTTSDRSLANHQALRVLGDNLILGSFGEYPSGFYAHNILSVWVDFGLIGLILYVASFVILFRALFSLNRGSGWPSKDFVSLCLLLFCVVLLAASKSCQYYLVPFVLGLCGTHVGMRNQANRFTVARMHEQYSVGH
jgi:hypothetical protein